MAHHQFATVCSLSADSRWPAVLVSWKLSYRDNFRAAFLARGVKQNSGVMNPPLAPHTRPVLKKNGNTFLKLRPLGALLLLIGVTAPSPSFANTWIGNTDANLATAANWSAAPVSGDNWTFGAAGSAGTALNNNLSEDFVVNGLTFSAGAANYTLSGNAITLSNSVSVGTGAQNQIVNLDIDLGGGAGRSMSRMVPPSR